MLFQTCMRLFLLLNIKENKFWRMLITKPFWFSMACIVFFSSIGTKTVHKNLLLCFTEGQSYIWSSVRVNKWQNFSGLSLTFHQFKCGLCFCTLLKTCCVTACASFCRNNVRRVSLLAYFCECASRLLIPYWASLNKLVSLFSFKRRQVVQQVQTECLLHAGSMLMLKLGLQGNGALRSDAV